MKMKKDSFFRKILGVFLMFLGILGGFLPIMPGFVFFIAGLSLISVDFAKDVKKSTTRYKCHRSIVKFLKEIFSSAVFNLKKSFLSIFKDNNKYI